MLYFFYSWQTVTYHKLKLIRKEFIDDSELEDGHQIKYRDLPDEKWLECYKLIMLRQWEIIMMNTTILNLFKLDEGEINAYKDEAGKMFKSQLERIYKMATDVYLDLTLSDGFKHASANEWAKLAADKKDQIQEIIKLYQPDAITNMLMRTIKDMQKLTDLKKKLATLIKDKNLEEPVRLKTIKYKKDVLENNREKYRPVMEITKKEKRAKKAGNIEEALGLTKDFETKLIENRGRAMFLIGLFDPLPDNWKEGYSQEELKHWRVKAHMKQTLVDIMDDGIRDKIVLRKPVYVPDTKRTRQSIADQIKTDQPSGYIKEHHIPAPPPLDRGAAKKIVAKKVTKKAAAKKADVDDKRDKGDAKPADKPIADDPKEGAKPGAAVFGGGAKPKTPPPIVKEPKVEDEVKEEKKVEKKEEKGAFQKAADAVGGAAKKIFNFFAGGAEQKEKQPDKQIIEQGEINDEDMIIEVKANNEKEQKDAAHFVELVAASALFDFLSKEKPETPQALSRAIRDNEDVLDISSLGEGYKDIVKRISNMMLLNLLIRILPNEGHFPLMKDRQFNADFYQDQSFVSLQEFIDKFYNWYSELSNNDRSFAPLNVINEGGNLTSWIKGISSKAKDESYYLLEMIKVSNKEKNEHSNKLRYLLDFVDEAINVYTKGF